MIVVAQKIKEVFDFVGRVASNISSIESLGNTLGATTEEVLRLQFVAEATGSSTEKLNSSLEGFNAVVRDAKGGSEGATQLLIRRCKV